MSDKPHIQIASDGPAELLTTHYESLAPPDATTPRAVFPGDLLLTREQEDRLVSRARLRFGQLDTELGRGCTGTTDTGLPTFLTLGAGERTMAQRTFMAKRLLYRYVMENDFSWRPLANPDSIFVQSNHSVPLCRRISRQMAARGINYFFGTEPYFSVYPIGGQDKELSDALQVLANLKLKDSGSHAVLREAIETAFDVGEAVLKVAHRNTRSFYRRRMTVAVGPDGTALLAQDGMPIEQTDLWVSMDPATPDSPQVLKRDGVTPQPSALVFAELLTDQEILHYRGPDVTKVYWRDFMCPLNAPSVQEADCCVHIMDMTASTLAAAYMESPGQSLDQLRTAIESLRGAINSPRTGQAATTQRAELGETTAPEVLDATMQIGEFYLKFDADEDGYEEDIMLVMDLNTDTPIYYNYVANVTDDGLRPFRVVRAKRVENRWYGQGAVEMFEEHQKVVDLMLNRRNRNQSEAGRLTLFHPQNTVEGQNDSSLKLNFGKQYTGVEGKRIEDVVEVAYLDDNKFDRLTEEIEFIMQMAMNESGVSHANDNFMAGMESSKLATGIRNVEKTGEELYGVMVSNLETGIESTVDCFVTTLFANLDEEETFTILEGDVPPQMAPDGQALPPVSGPREYTVSKKEVQGLRFNVTVLLTRMRDEQIMQSSAQAEALVTKFYSLPPPLQALLAPFYVNMLKALQIPNAKQFIQPQQFSIAAPTGGGVTVPVTPGDTPNVPPPNL